MCRKNLGRWDTSLRLSLVLFIGLVYLSHHRPGRPTLVVWSWGSNYESLSHFARWFEAKYGCNLTGVVTGAWRRYLCPFGAFFSLFNKISFLALRRRQSRCRSCNKYPRDCFLRGDCLQSYPGRAIGFALRGRKPKEAEASGLEPACQEVAMDHQPGSGR